MRANSLALRLFLSATVWTVLILFVTGFVLSGLYRDSVERAFDRRLGVYLKTLIADLASPDISMEKTGQMLGVYTDWTPVTGRPGLFKEEIDTSDPWQFNNVLVR